MPREQEVGDVVLHLGHGIGACRLHIDSGEVLIAGEEALPPSHDRNIDHIVRVGEAAAALWRR